MSKHVHHDLIVQWAKDTTQVIECKDNLGDWVRDYHPLWDEYYEYRIRHKHQDLIDQKAARPELIVELLFCGHTWKPCTDPVWNPSQKYRLVEPEPEKKKVKMWQWVVKTVDNDIKYMTNCFYSSADEVRKNYTPRHYQIVQRADWTEIEVEE